MIDRFSVENSLTAGSRTCRQNSLTIREFVRDEQIRRPQEITAEAVRHYLLALAGRGRSPKTVCNAKFSLSAFCHSLEDAGAIPFNPCHKVRLRRPPRTPIYTISGHRRVLDLLAACEKSGGFGPTLRNAVALALATGLRRGELCRLAWADVDMHRRCLTVTQAKNGEPRTVPLNTTALDALNRQAAITGHMAWVFPARRTHRGGAVEWLDKPVSAKALSERFAAVAGQFKEFRQLKGHRIGRGFHLLRHSFATNLAAHADPFRLRDWLGHKDIRMTERYIHLAKVYDPTIERASI